MYDSKSKKAEEFISDEEILDTIAYAKENRGNKELIQEILQQAESFKGLNHRQVAVLLECVEAQDQEVLQEVHRIAMKIKEHIFTAEKADCLMNDFKAGLSYVLKNKALFYCCLIASACNMLLVPMNALQSAFITTYYHGDASYLSLMGIALSLGSLLGASVYPVISNHCKNKTLIIIIFPACSFLYLSELILGFTDSQLSIMIGIAIIYFLTGLFVGVASCHISVMVMLKTKQEYLSRVSSLLNAASNGLIPVTSFTISALAAFFTPDTLFLISGIIILLFSVGSYMSRRLEVLND